MSESVQAAPMLALPFEAAARCSPTARSFFASEALWLETGSLEIFTHLGLSRASGVGTWVVRCLVRQSWFVLLVHVFRSFEVGGNFSGA